MADFNVWDVLAAIGGGEKYIRLREQRNERSAEEERQKQQQAIQNMLTELQLTDKMSRIATPQARTEAAGGPRKVLSEGIPMEGETPTGPRSSDPAMNSMLEAITGVLGPDAAKRIGLGGMSQAQSGIREEEAAFDAETQRIKGRDAELFPQELEQAVSTEERLGEVRIGNEIKKFDALSEREFEEYKRRAGLQHSYSMAETAYRASLDNASQGGIDKALQTEIESGAQFVGGSLAKSVRDGEISFEAAARSGARRVARQLQAQGRTVPHVIVMGAVSEQLRLNGAQFENRKDDGGPQPTRE